MRALFNSRLNGVLTVQGLFDDQLESFSAVEEERPSSSVLTLALGSPERGTIRVWRVLVLAERRGPPSEARGLYEELSGQA